MLKKYLLLPALAGTALLTGCIKDDSSDCHPGLELAYAYTLNNEGVDRIATEVDRITVFVFDEDGIYLDRYPFSEEEFKSKNHTVALPLQAGDYTVISLGGNLENSYSIGGKNNISAGLVPGKTRLEDFRVSLKCSHPLTGRPIGNNPASLFYSKSEVTAHVSKVNTYGVGLMKNTSTVLFRITEKYRENNGQTHPRTKAASPYTLYCMGINNLLDHQNNIPAEEAPEMQYNPHSISQHGNTYEKAVNMMRLIAGTPVNVTLQHTGTGKNLVNENLLSLILAHKSKYSTQTDLDKEDLFTIDFEVNENPANPDVSVTVKVNGWTVTIVRPEF